MGSMKGKQAKIDAALGRLADMISGGHLMASADPVGFLDTIATELRELRDENVKLRGLIDVTAMNLQSGESIRVVHPLFQVEGGGSTPTSPLQLHVGESPLE